jgi:hypothetical protein
MWWYGPPPMWGVWWFFPIIGLIFLVFMCFVFSRFFGRRGGFCISRRDDEVEELRGEVRDLKSEVENLKKRENKEA